MPERMMVAELERQYAAVCQELAEVEQILGEALGFPRYCDDPKNFPDATEADGVCVGEYTPATLAEAMAKSYAGEKEDNKKMRELFMRGRETSSMAASLEQEQKDFKDLADLFETQSGLLKTTQERLKSALEAVAKRQATNRILEGVIITMVDKLNYADTLIHNSNIRNDLLEKRLDNLTHLSNRLSRMIYEVSDEAMPKPDWATIPEKYVWWTVDADGEVYFWESKPHTLLSLWCLNPTDEDTNNDENLFGKPEEENRFASIPLGIDWRMLIARRPGTEENGEEE